MPFFCLNVDALFLKIRSDMRKIWLLGMSTLPGSVGVFLRVARPGLPFLVSFAAQNTRRWCAKEKNEEEASFRLAKKNPAS